MSGQPYITRRDLSYTVCFLLGIGGWWFLPYAFSRWSPNIIFIPAIGMLVGLVMGFLAAAGFVLRPFISRPKDVRAAQVLLRITSLLVIVSMVIWKQSWPNPASEGDWHRLKDRGNPEDFRAFAQWLLKQAEENPSVDVMEIDEINEFLTSREGEKFAPIAQIWGLPDYVTVEKGPHASAVSVGWGGGFGHWSVDVRFDTIPVLPDMHSEVWKWQDGLYFRREIQ